nr:uncharacterized protein LOC129445950 [Misgurnus anguillicaudatus]XP_055062910.1 uncharacterized protein LOC129445950 [Misgurnus anguillicaudatus]
MAEFSQNGRFWEYHRLLEIFGAANPLASMLEEMEKKGLVVRNIPPIIHEPASYGRRASSTRQAEREMPAAVEEPEPENDENIKERYQSNGPRWSVDVRVEMAKKGLYKKHSIKHDLLDGFYHYLRVDLENRRSKQEVENVARFLYFMDPKEPSLLFVHDMEKVREYFNILTVTKLAKQTVLNYWKSLKRFMRYTLTSTNLQKEDPSLFSDCKRFMDPLEGICTGMSKKINKELNQKRYNGYGKEKQLTDCVAILDVARADFLEVIEKLQGRKAVSADRLEKNDRLLVLYYLEAIVILRHLQRPGVLTNMTVEEWQRRRPLQNGCSVAVKEHKTAASQVAEIPLTAEHEHWFSIYFKHIRPVMLQGSGAEGNSTAEGHFFIRAREGPSTTPATIWPDSIQSTTLHP